MSCESPPLIVARLGRLPYREAWDLQRRLFDARRNGSLPDCLLLLEHPPTITLGRRGGAANVLAAPETLASLGVDVVEIDRGGDVTYHGPGQVVGYPILDLSKLLPDLHGYVRALEEVMIRLLADFGVPGRRIEGLSGAWVGDEKIGAIGVKVKSWVTMHGFAFNVARSTAGFGLIVPCGIRDHGVTSLERLLGRPVGPSEVVDGLAKRFAEVFGLTPISAPEGLPPELAAPLAAPDAGDSGHAREV